MRLYMQNADAMSTASCVSASVAPASRARVTSALVTSRPCRWTTRAIWRSAASFGLTPLARFVGYAVAGVAPGIMGIGPIAVVPKLLAQTGIRQADIAWIELNEAFAAQSLAVIRELGLDPSRINPLGGAIALGHPLGATGAIRTATIVHGLRRAGQRYGMVTMCVGTGMGAAGLFEAV